MLLNREFNTSYRPGEQAPARPVRHIHGRSLAKLPLPKRVQAAVDLLTRKAEVEPCLRQTAALCRISEYRLRRALADRRPTPTLADRLVLASAEERVAAIRAVGIDKVVAWLCEAERVNVAAE
jgi:hypothetical protein